MVTHMGQKRSSRGSARPLIIPRGGPSVPKICWDPIPNGLTYTNQIWNDNTWSVFLEGQPWPYPKGAAAPASPKFVGTPTTPIRFDLDRPNLVRQHMWGRSVFPWVSHAPIPRGWASAGCSPILLGPLPTPKRFDPDRIWRDNIYGGVACF